jgi:hypothetical protein
MDPLDQLHVEEDKKDIQNRLDELTLILQNRYSLGTENFGKVLIGKVRSGEIAERGDVMKWLALNAALSDYQ